MENSKNKVCKSPERRFFMGCILSAAAFAAVIGLFLRGTDAFSGRMETEGAETLQKAIRRTCVQCYAIEGRYPPSVEYLETEYGIRIDRSRYDVFYSGFASNVMPDITVVPVVKAERGQYE